LKQIQFFIDTEILKHIYTLHKTAAVIAHFMHIPQF